MGEGASTAVLLHDDQVWTLKEARSESGAGTFTGVTFSGEPAVQFEVPGARLSFVISGPEEMYALGWDAEEGTYQGETQTIVGDQIVSFDTSGEATRLWSSFDAFDFDGDATWTTDSGFYPDVDGAIDWSHVNSLSYHQEQDAFFVTSDGLEAVVRVDRASGATDWVLSDSFGDFEVLGEQRLVSSPHSVQWLGDDRILVFNRRLQDDALTDGPCATTDEIALDFEAGTASIVRTYGLDDCLTVAFLGKAQEDDAGYRWISYGSAGRVDVLDPDGILISQAQLDIGAAFGFHEAYASLY
jgi:hypothetical protein